MATLLAYAPIVRADRLVAIVLLLQTHGQLTAGQLAEMLETSERTIRRDLDALCVAGVPLYPQRGRGGGWALLGGHRIDLSGLTADEARALFLMGAEAGRDLQAALRKVLAALPEPLRAVATAAGRSAHVDPAGWGRSPVEEPAALAALQRAAADRVQVDIDYAKPGEPPRRRRVHPYGLVRKSGVWYLLAGTGDGRRTFRVSRVVAAAATDQPADVPDGFELAEAWGQAEQDFRGRMSAAGVEVEVEVAASAVLAFTGAFRGWAEARDVGGPEPAAGGAAGDRGDRPASRGGAAGAGRSRPAGQCDDPTGDATGEEAWRRFVVAVPHVRAAAVHLAPFGDAVRVRAPDELRAELRRIGEALVRANG